MKKEEQFLLWFEQLERKDVDIVGGKSSSLGEMTAKTDVPVPYGFATTAYAYRYFIKESGLEEKMRSILSELTDVENSALLRDVSGIMANEKVNVLGVSSRTDTKRGIATMDIQIELNNVEMLDKLLKRVMQIDDVIDAKRLSN